MNDDFGDRMKAYEASGTAATIPARLPLCVRLDGKGFSRFTKGFDKPFDRRITDAMDATTRALVDELHPNIAYVQSDEITLVFTCGAKASEHVFGGKLSKINSIAASMATAAFNGRGVSERSALFDCRTWGVPDSVEASNVLLWRAQDCRRNSISACYRWIAHRKQMPEQPEMLAHLRDVCGFDWTGLPDRERFGAFFARVTAPREVDEATWARIPEKHRPASRTVLRSEVVSLGLRDFGALTLAERVAVVSRPGAE